MIFFSCCLINHREQEIQSPTSEARAAELAWHFFLPGQQSGFMYYGNALDMPVKQTIACNIANAYAAQAIASNSSFQDTVGPSIWALQRLPWNPGGYGMGSLWNWKYTKFNDTSFYVWTFAYDVSGISSCAFLYRRDLDGINPLEDHANEVFANSPESVGPWQSIAMTRHIMPVGNIYNESITLSCDATGKPCLPNFIADEYWVHVPALPAKSLLDYYVSCTDNKGNIKTSDIYHVYIG